MDGLAGVAPALALTWHQNGPPLGRCLWAPWTQLTTLTVVNYADWALSATDVRVPLLNPLIKTF